LEGTFAADTFGPACVQNQPQLSKTYTLPAEILQSEDCLSLNIWAPERAEDAAVFFWIHGGSLTIGSSSEPMYDGENLAKRGMIVVTINYRLGAFGWLAHPELSKEQGGTSGNYGVLDQICALEWVRANIRAFGGNPGNITVAGESAGALSAMYLMASPLARGLFHKVIAQSPYMISTPALTRRVHGHKSAEQSGAEFAKGIGADDIEAMRAIDAKRLMLGATRHSFAPWGAIDGKVIPDQLISIFSRGEQAGVPVLTGFNTGEIRSLRALAPPVPQSPMEYEAAIRERYGNLAQQFLRLYPSQDMEESILATTRDTMYGWSSRKLAEGQSNLGHDAFLYLWDHGYPEADIANMHAFHGSDVPFVFGNLDRTGPFWPKVPLDAQQVATSELLCEYWSEFAKASDPTSPDGTKWLPFSAERPSQMRFDRGAIFETYPFAKEFEFHDAMILERRKAGNVMWNWNVGLLAPTSS